MILPTTIKNTYRGFTLIELLVVIAIIGILSSVVLASLSTAREKARDSKRIAQVGQIQKSLELYYQTYQSYPSTTPAGYSGDDAGIQTLITEGLLPTIPLPPVGTNSTYIYRGTYDDAGGVRTDCDAPAPVDTVCSGYELGVTLERSDSTVLQSDADNSVGTFYGTYPDCVVNTPGTEQCYDISS